MTVDWIAEVSFLAQPPDGAARPVTIRIARPEQVGAGEWTCAVAMEGLHDRLAPVHGADALQALTLAWQLAGRLLAGFVERGGRLSYPSGEAVALESYGLGSAWRPR